LRVCAVYGGASIERQKEKLYKGVHVVVGTPGRVHDMIRQRALKVGKIERLILDEADEMLNMGFKEELFNIMEFTPETKQSVLFSATMPRDVITLANEFMHEPHRISSSKGNQGADNIQHFYYKVNARDKYKALKRIADVSPSIYGIVFCQTRLETQDIAEKLQHDGYSADALHGDLPQSQREYVMNRFRNQHVQLLVATDVAARGLDVNNLTHIINYHPPRDPNIYIHRSGRTGRAGKSGISITIIHSKEIGSLKALERRLGKDIVWAHVPTGKEICEKQLFKLVEKVEKIEVDTEQIGSFLEDVYKKLSWLTREELIQHFISVEFNRFLLYYKDVKDLDFEVAAPRPRRDKRDVNFSLFSLNIGYSDGLTKRELLSLMNRLKVSRSLEIGQINISQKSTTVELEAVYERQLVRVLNKNKYNRKNMKAKVERSHFDKD
jgi:ATP-dependent RNA helicase DeaD